MFPRGSGRQLSKIAVVEAEASKLVLRENKHSTVISFHYGSIEPVSKTAITFVILFLAPLKTFLIACFKK